MSHTSEFLLIVPPEWIEVPDVQTNVLDYGGHTIITVEDAVEQYPSNLEPFIEHMVDIFPLGNTITNVRIIKTELSYRIWIQYVPLPPQ